MPELRTDAQLVAAYLSGDRGALAGMYDRYGAGLYDTAAAMLRDRLRAPIIAADPGTAGAAARARGRGIEVVLVDARGLDDSAPAVRSSVLAAVADALDSTTTGSVVVRVLPPDRALVATVVIDPQVPGSEPVRLEFSADGERVDRPGDNLGER